MYIIRKEFAFSASHQLGGLRADHPCSRMHGHNYVVIIELKLRTLDKTGFVLDYRDLEPIKKYLDENFDHRHLNDVIPFNPTAENLAECFHSRFTELLPINPSYLSVTVSETPKTTARYEPDNY